MASKDERDRLEFNALADKAAAAGISQKDLAPMLDRTPKTLQRYKRKGVKVDTLALEKLRLLSIKGFRG